MSKYTLSLPITVNNQVTTEGIKIDIKLPKSCPYCEQVQTPFVKSSSGLEKIMIYFQLYLFVMNVNNIF